jgi:hypothetical protein
MEKKKTKCECTESLFGWRDVISLVWLEGMGVKHVKGKGIV